MEFTDVTSAAAYMDIDAKSIFRKLVTHKKITVDKNSEIVLEKSPRYGILEFETPDNTQLSDIIVKLNMPACVRVQIIYKHDHIIICPRGDMRQ